MKRKAIGICSLVIIVLSVFAIYRLNTSESEKIIMGQSQELNVANNATLVKGEKDPSTYKYKTSFGSWEYTTTRFQYANGWQIPYKSGYEVYCAEPNAHVSDIWEITKANYDKIFGSKPLKRTITKSGSRFKCDVEKAFNIKEIATHRMESSL